MHSSYQEFISHGHGKFGPWFDLVNSEEWDTFGRRTEHFHNPAWLPFFLRRWHFPRNKAKSFPLAKYQALRSALRAICEAAAARQAISPAALHTLNQAMNVRGKRQLCDGQNGFAVEFVSENSDWAGILAETAHSFASLLSKSELSRIKICRN